MDGWMDVGQVMPGKVSFSLVHSRASVHIFVSIHGPVPHAARESKRAREWRVEWSGVGQ